MAKQFDKPKVMNQRAVAIIARVTEEHEAVSGSAIVNLDGLVGHGTRTVSFKSVKRTVLNNYSRCRMFRPKNDSFVDFLD